MRKFCTALLFALVSASSLAAPPSRESVLALLDAMQTQATLDQAYGSIEQMIKRGLSQEMSGRKLNEEQQRVMDAAPARLAALMREELSWEKMQPVYVGLYQESFDQAEIDGLIAFYSTPVGRSYIAKMPAVMTRMMGVTQMQMQAFMPKLKRAMDDLVREAKLPPKT